MTSFGIPVIVYEEDMKLSDEGTYFLVSGNGLWIHKDTGIVRAFVPVDQISILPDLDAKSWVSCTLPKLSVDHVWQIQNFFKDVVKKHHAEAMTTLYYSKAEQKFKVYIPHQQVSSAGVQYKRAGMTGVEGLESYLPVMTIHSHSDFSAFHSGTDVGDEEDFDGVHCTFGHNNREAFSIVASIVVNGHRLPVDPLDILEGIEPVKSIEKKFSWITGNTKEKEGFYKFSDVTEEDKVSWGNASENWMSRVARWTEIFDFVQTEDSPQVIHSGDYVMVSGPVGPEEAAVMTTATCGNGPFRVESVDDGKIVIKTNVGLAQFPDKLFTKASNDKADKKN